MATATKENDLSDIVLNKRSKKLVRKFNKRGVVYWASDDSPKAFNTLGIMIQHAEAAGHRVLRLTSAETIWLRDDKQLSSGSFVMVEG